MAQDRHPTRTEEMSSQGKEMCVLEQVGKQCHCPAQIVAVCRDQKLQRELWAVGCNAQNCFRRSANRNNANNVWNVNSSGNVNNNNASNANRCAPSLYVITHTRLSHSESAAFLKICTEPSVPALCKPIPLCYGAVATITRSHYG